MNDAKAIHTTAPAIIQEYAAQMMRVLQNIKQNDTATHQLQLNALRKAVFIIGRVLMSCSLEEVHAVTRATWLEVLSIPKLSFSDNLDKDEAAILETVKSSYAEGPSNPQFIRYYLLARLFLVPYRDPPVFDWNQIPVECLQGFIEYQLESPQLIRVGDHKQYYRHLVKSLTRLLEFASTLDATDQRLNFALAGFMGKFSSNIIMMLDENALPVMQARNRIFNMISRKMVGSDPAWSPPPRDSEKIRLGIMIKTLMAGGETWAALANIAGLDKSRYEIIIFCFTHDAGYYHDIGYYRELMPIADDIVLLRSGNIVETVAKIRSYNIDIMWHQSHLGLSESSLCGLVLTHRLARIQCATYMMHAHTTGNPYFQYFLNIPTAFPPKTWEGEFSETELNLPGIAIYIPEHWSEKPSQIVTRESLGIPSDAVVYFGGAAAAKYNPEFLVAWLKIIKTVPNSYLALYPFNPAWCPIRETIVAFHVRLYSLLKESGVNPDRIKVLDGMNGEAIIAMHSWGQVFLSSIPYGGVTSLSDALRSGLACVCGAGTYSRCNGDSNIMAAYGLLDLIARSTEEYIEKAVRLGTDTFYRESVQARIKDAEKSKRPRFKAQVSASYAALIDQIAMREFGLDENEPAKSLSA